MNKLRQVLEKALKQEECFVDSETGNINYIKVKDSADRIDEKLISILSQNKELKDKFFIKIKDVYVFNIQDFKFFLDENKIDNSYTKYANQIGLSFNGELVKDIDNVVLDFPFKDCVLEGGQSTEEGIDTGFEYSEKSKKYEKHESNRKEIFFNQILAQDEIDRLFDRKALVNWKRFTKDSKKDGEAVKEIKRDKNGTLKENLIIKGNNLLALHSLKSEFTGKIKLIYIDPPYNTGNDGFKYNDNFSSSTWLSFMKNRLEIAKDLLSDDGSIYVQMDVKEAHYLKILMDEIFGRNNFRSEVLWDTSIPYVAGNKWLSNNWIYSHSVIFYYAKNKQNVFFKKQTFEVKQPSGDISIKPHKDIWTDIKNFAGFLGVKDIKVDFNTRKPEALLQRIIESATNKGDIVLDYHLGSGTTCAVAHKMNRQYIGIEQMNYVEEISVPRLKEVIYGEQNGISKEINWQGGGEFIYCELAKWNEQAKEEIQNAKDLPALVKLFDTLYEKYFLNYNVKIKDFKDKIVKEENFKKLTLAQQKKMFLTMLDLNQMYVQESEMSDKKFGISKEDQKLTKEFYQK